MGKLAKEQLKRKSGRKPGTLDGGDPVWLEPFLLHVARGETDQAAAKQADVDPSTVMRWKNKRANATRYARAKAAGTADNERLAVEIALGHAMQGSPWHFAVWAAAAVPDWWKRNCAVRREADPERQSLEVTGQGGISFQDVVNLANNGGFSGGGKSKRGASR